MGPSTGGVTGRFLRIDLTTGDVEIFQSPSVEIWLGARGWNALLAWRDLAPGTGPFDPENTLVLSAGPLVGSGAPTAGRTTFATIGPRGYPQPRWTSSSMGGYLGAELKYAGYDGAVIVGRANSPCYLLIDDEHVSIRQADDLWGQGTFATQQMLKERHSRQHQIAAIGPAGENRVRFAGIIHRLSNAVGNGGFGGVMGAKNLKAICVRGSRGVPIADPSRFFGAVQRVSRLTRGGIGHVGTTQQGYPVVACSHGCTVNCFMRIVPTPRIAVDAGSLRMLKCVNSSFSGGSHLVHVGGNTPMITL